MKAMLLRFSFIFLLCSFLLPSCNSIETGISINGKIMNLDNYNFADSFIQLVTLNPDSQKLELDEVIVTRDIDDNILSVDCVSEFPKLELSNGGKFKYKIKDLKPGRYIMVIQHLSPLKKPNNYFGPIPYLNRPLGKEKNKINVVEISEKNKPPYSINLGEVNITYNKSNKFIIIEFDEVDFIKP